ncbi:AP-3 complex subunit delta [Operophtera brumata]|uniref:AP-3 complex subunit delta n=1 Tax=Operophtera brumata TaxID=104452 RepID=A0A0L7KMC1_OPEBR|nr:AP-3 complex subunit delta [Operophtera brumata]
MSLLYECINTVIAVLISISSGMPGHAASVQLCVQKLRILIEDSDQNLKYLGLLAMSRILKSHPKSVQAHKDLVLACLDDKDESIRLRALGLLYGMKLMIHMERAEGTLYRDELLTRMIEICSQNNYQHVLTEVGARVAEVRSFCARECAALCSKAAASPPGAASREVLYAAAFVLAEYCNEVISPLLVCAGVGGGHMRARAVCMHAALKLTVKLLAILRNAIDGMKPLLCSEDMEVQERAHNGSALLSIALRRLSNDDQLLDNAAAGASRVQRWTHRRAYGHLREARRQEQANNPHYLKDDSPRGYQQDDIPIAEIALEVPLQVHGTYTTSRTTRRAVTSRTIYRSRRSRSKCRCKCTVRTLPQGRLAARLPAGRYTDRGDRARSAAASARPLREEEILATRISQYPSPDAVLLEQPKQSKKKSSGKTTNDKPTKKKEKKSKQNKEVDLILPELAKDADLLVDAKSNGKKRSKSRKAADEAPKEGYYLILGEGIRE